MKTTFLYLPIDKAEKICYEYVVRKHSGIRGRERQQKLFDLYSSGFDIKSPEVKELGYRPASLRGYYRIWQKTGGVIPSKAEDVQGGQAASRSPHKAEIAGSTPAPATRQKTKLPGGESIEAIREIIPEVINPDEPALDKPAEEKPKEEKKEIPTSIVGSGITATVKISIKTLALYEIARNLHRASKTNGAEDLALGDFFDICVEDTYRGRGKDLGLVSLSKEVEHG